MSYTGPADGGPLAGVRIVESSMLGPAAITSTLIDMGAEVIKVEPPQGDYVREMTWPIVEGVSLMHLHINRGKRSLVLDLNKQEAVGVYLDLVRRADAVVEAMRPGGLERRGLGYETLKSVNPRIVYCTISGYGTTGPYADLPSHGVAYDTWAGVVEPAVDDDGFTFIPDHVSIGINAAPLFGALGILAGIIRARSTGQGCRLELAQSDSAAAFDWYRSESWRAYERPQAEVTGNTADNFERRAPGMAGMHDGVRYNIYAAADGHVLFMASERAFWKNFCEAVDRVDLFERWPGSRYADHARGNRELRAELRDIFAARTVSEWLALGRQSNTPIAPVNTPQSLPADPQFRERLSWIPAERLGADQLPCPVKFFGTDAPEPERAPSVGEHTELVLREVLSYDARTMERLRRSGALGPQGSAAPGPDPV